VARQQGPAGYAVLAMATRIVQTYDADRIAFLHLRDPGPDRRDDATTFMALNERSSWFCRPVSIGRVQITHASSGDLHWDFRGRSDGTGTSSIVRGALERRRPLLASFSLG
jgi:hypothetical protein